ncbi:MAG: hypothetical protein HZC55_04305 [Verrucomicrobia bacterium]|nr:hypothetical protein [Verrucomicrobiota bacterium]
MKNCLLLPLFLLSAALACGADKSTGGPRGGRLLESSPLAAEFLVTPERRIEITFLDSQRQPVAPGTRVVAVTAEPKSGRTPLALTRTATGFVSTAALPSPGETYRVVVQIRENAEARPQNFRIDLNLAPCGECKLAEYACTCTH